MKNLSELESEGKEKPPPRKTGRDSSKSFYFFKLLYLWRYQND